MTKRLIVLLLCAAGISLAACSKDKSNTPEEEQTKTGSSSSSKGKEADIVVKYFLNDSLLQYVDIVIRDSSHLEDGMLPYSTAPLDTLGADAEIWNGLLGKFYHFDPTLYDSIPVSAIRVLTLSRHVSQASHSYCLCFERNSTPVRLPETHILIAQASTCSLNKWNSQRQVEIQKGVRTNELMPYLLRIQNKMKTAISL